jgi:hypothetical protein
MRNETQQSALDRSFVDYWLARDRLLGNDPESNQTLGRDERGARSRANLFGLFGDRGRASLAPLRSTRCHPEVALVALVELVGTDRTDRTDRTDQ